MTPCRKCGAAESTQIVLVKDGEEIGTGLLCGPCLDRALEGAAELRATFESLLAAGVDRAEANRRMIALIDERRAGAS